MRLALLASAALALAPTAESQTPTGATIVGTVYDSVRLRPMSGARVRVGGSELYAVADADGRFRIDGIPAGQHFLAVEHPLIDTLGIALRSATLTFAATDAKATELATPSPEALVDRLCSAAWRARGPAALMGRVRDADTGNPAIGAKVSLVWYEIEASTSLRKAPRVREATVGPDGMYRICGLPAQLEGKVQVLLGALTSGDVLLNFGHDLLGLRSMSIAASVGAIAIAPPAPVAPGDTSPPPPPRLVGSARLTGRVLNKANQPIAGARVLVDGTTRLVETRMNGEFAIDSLPAGTQSVSVTKLGYSPIYQAVDLTSRNATTVTISMDDFVPVLETVRVNAARERVLDDIGFARRQRIGTGWFLEGDEIKSRTALFFSDVLRMAPGIAIKNAGGNRQWITNSRDPVNGCVAFFIDGAEYQQIEPGDLDEYVKPWEVGAIEVYTPTGTPAEFMGRQKGSCSTVVIWTVRKLDRKK